MRHRSGHGHKTISKALSVPRNTLASMIVKWKYETMRSLLGVFTRTEIENSSAEMGDPDRSLYGAHTYPTAEHGQLCP